MSVRAALLAALAALLAAASPALAQVHQPTPAGTLDATLVADGPPLGVESQPGSGIGDSGVVVRQQVREAEVTWRGAPGPVSLDAGVGLRGLAVRSPALPMAAALLAHAGEARPAAVASAPWPYVGPDGIDFTSDLVVERHAGDGGWPMLIYPDTWYDLDWGLGYDGVSLPALVQESSDRQVENAADSAVYPCYATQRDFGVPLGSACDSPAPLAEALLPDVRVLSDLVDVRVLASPLAAAADVARGLGAESNRVPAGGDGASGLVPFHGTGGARAAAGFDAAPRPAAGDARSVAGAPLSTQSNGGAGWSFETLQNALPAMLATLALLAPAWALYRRLTPPDALQHPLREDMLLRIRAHPGIHESQLAREMGLRHTHVQYHLRVLRQSRIVEERRFGGLKCLFESGRLSEAEKGHAMNERGRGPEVLHGVVEAPGISQRELARKLGMSESSVKWHLDRLTQAGLVRTDRARGSKRAWAEPAAAPKPGPVAAPVAAVLPALGVLPCPPAE